MLALLLAAASLSPYALRATVTFPGGRRVVVAAPTSPDVADVTWSHVETVVAPGGRAAVRFCWDAMKHHGCAVLLARPGHPVLELKNSDVTHLLWTKDGKYLIGAGVNTVRLWNTAGRVRAVTPGAEIDGESPLRLGEKSVCVRTVGEVTRYTVPTLRLLGRQTVFSDHWTCR